MTTTTMMIGTRMIEDPTTTGTRTTIHGDSPPDEILTVETTEPEAARMIDNVLEEEAVVQRRSNPIGKH